MYVPPWLADKYCPHTLDEVEWNRRRRNAARYRWTGPPTWFSTFGTQRDVRDRPPNPLQMCPIACPMAMLWQIFWLR